MQADLNLCWRHIFEGTFSDIVAQILLIIYSNHCHFYVFIAKFIAALFLFCVQHTCSVPIHCCVILATQEKWEHINQLKCHFNSEFVERPQTGLIRSFTCLFCTIIVFIIFFSSTCLFHPSSMFSAETTVYGPRHTRHMRRAKAQISLRVRAVWSRPSLSIYRISGYYRIYRWRAEAWMILYAWTGLSDSVHFAHVRMHVFAWRGPFFL